MQLTLSTISNLWSRSNGSVDAIGKIKIDQDKILLCCSPLGLNAFCQSETYELFETDPVKYAEGLASFGTSAELNGLSRIRVTLLLGPRQDTKRPGCSPCSVELC